MQSTPAAQDQMEKTNIPPSWDAWGSFIQGVWGRQITWIEKIYTGYTWVGGGVGKGDEGTFWDINGVKKYYLPLEITVF